MTVQYPGARPGAIPLPSGRRGGDPPGGRGGGAAAGCRADCHGNAADHRPRRARSPIAARRSVRATSSTRAGGAGRRLQEVHPPQEVVAAYRDVSSAAEEKVTAINQAEGIPQRDRPAGARAGGAERGAGERLHLSTASAAPPAMPAGLRRWSTATAGPGGERRAPLPGDGRAGARWPPEVRPGPVRRRAAPDVALRRPALRPPRPARCRVRASRCRAAGAAGRGR